ncbi:unnamed protein product, partial [Prorocentrum cordatum]
VDWTAPDAVMNFYLSIPDHRLCHSKFEKVNLGKFQHPVSCGNKSVSSFSLRGYLFNVAALSLGFHGVDRRKAQSAMQDGIKEVSSSGGLPSKPSLKQHAHESITASCANQLDKAAYIYGDYTNLEKQRLILAVLTPTQTYHGRQNQTLRDAKSTVPWEIDMCSGGFAKCEQLSMTTIRYRRIYRKMGIESSWGPMRLCLADPRLQKSEEHVQLLVDLVFQIVLEHTKRNLVFSHGLPRRQCLWLSGDGRAAEFLKRLEADKEIYMVLKTCTFEGSELMVKRSLFAKPSVKHLLACVEAENWLPSERLRSHIAEKCQRIIGSQIVEDTFNKCKKKIDCQTNTLTGPISMMATALDSKVISKTHRYEELVPNSVVVPRDCVLANSVCHAPLLRKNLEPSTASLELWKIAGFGDAGWHSPGAAGYTVPCADIEVCRQASSAGKMSLINQAIFSQLVHQGLVVRKKGAGSPWKCAVGCVDGRLAVLWPMKEVGPMKWSFDCTGTRELVAVFDDEEWEATPVVFTSPMRQAIESELVAEGRSLTALDAEASDTHGDLVVLVQAEGDGKVMSLMHAALMSGFWALPVSYMMAVCALKRWDVTTMSLAGLLTTIAKKALPIYSDAILAQILARRIGTMDSQQHMEDIMELEWVADIFDKTVAEEIQQQANTAKAHKSL